MQLGEAGRKALAEINAEALLHPGNVDLQLAGEGHDDFATKLIVVKGSDLTITIPSASEENKGTSLYFSSYYDGESNWYATVKWGDGNYDRAYVDAWCGVRLISIGTTWVRVNGGYY